MRRSMWLGVGLGLLGAHTGCSELLDIDHIEFGEPSGSSAGGAGGAGGDNSGGNAQGGQDELCLDGVDNDGDQQIDCADPDCAAYRCAALPPAGWSGPAIVAVHEAVQAPPSCPAPWADREQGNLGLNAPEAACEPCGCSPPSGGSCGLPTSVSYDPSGCSGGIEATLSPAAPNTCYGFDVGDPTNSTLGGTVPVDDEGSCNADGGQAMVEPVSWQQTATACTATVNGGGCNAGSEACVVRPSGPFRAELCITHSGDEACPPGPYSEKILMYYSYSDTRDCSGCACGNATGGACSGTTQIFTGDNNCSNHQADVPNDGATCVSWLAMGPSNSFIYVPDPGPYGGSCQPTGGEPTGSAQAEDPITICCEP